jgi:hypothetical protein
MKTLLMLVILIQSLLLSSQTNYLIEYDKINNHSTYYKCDWEKGVQTKKEVKSIKVNQNDILIVKIINVNTFIYQPDIIQTYNIQEKNSSQISKLVNFFTGAVVSGGVGGTAFSLINSLSATTRGERNTLPAAISESAQLLDIGDNLISNIISGITDYQKAVKVKFSKTKTKNEILAELKYNKEKMQNFNADELMFKLDSVTDKLNEISKNIEPDHEILNDIDRYKERLTVFNNKFKVFLLDGVNCNLLEDIKEVEKSSFTHEQRFIARSEKGEDYYVQKYSSNEIIIQFISLGNIELVKNFSIPVVQPNKPHWALTVNSIIPIGELNYYRINNVFGDKDNVMPSPDSLNIMQSSIKGMQLSLGTQLCFDINKEKSLFIPSICVGFAISGLNQAQEDWNISFLLGSSISLKKFPYVSLNTGMSFTQTKQLKSQYKANQTFEIAPNFEYDENTFYNKVYLPGFYFGLSIKL